MHTSKLFFLKGTKRLNHHEEVILSVFQLSQVSQVSQAFQAFQAFQVSQAFQAFQVFQAFRVFQAFFMKSKTKFPLAKSI